MIQLAADEDQQFVERSDVDFHNGDYLAVNVLVGLKYELNTRACGYLDWIS